jgi:peptidoglycan/LPS O-acetylase OafA/YrhL
MSPSKVRVGELLALVGAACVIVSLLVPYYEGPTTGALTVWDTFGPAAALLLGATAAGLCLFAATLTERSTALPVVATVWAIPLGLAGAISAIVRLLERPENATAVCAGAWLALAGTLAILVGAWRAIGDERRSKYTPAAPAPRPAPNGGDANGGDAG